MADPSKTAPVLTEKELVITREFDAPRELVWRAWSEPEMFKRWWGPEGYTAPVVEIDFRVGGKFLGCMRAPNGKDFWSTGTYLEIVEPERIVTTDSFADEKGNVVPASHYGFPEDHPTEMKVTVTFEDLGGDRTRMTLLHEGLPGGAMREGAGQGWSTSFDKLAAVLAEAS